ncbi:DUF4124 domain-containing protein [Exilibacterium tricleocarpae]|uniref:DUF4124 domain-containing protein n=1 Tax=Exilibacterium tricleocarpae TaxID=2591008 RepID=UPI0015D1EB3C|nr:DUF4124 domain-containing protein [Exilibacterium tricleocarpae]
MKTRLGLLVLVALPLWAPAEVYRWVDENGKVHFSDRKPQGKAAAEDISEAVSKTNIDDSTQQNQKLGDVFPKETAAEKALRQRQTQERQTRRQQHDKDCKRARKLLDVLRGRVYFVDENGQPYNISERERKEREAKLQAEINQYCG